MNDVKLFYVEKNYTVYNGKLFTFADACKKAEKMSSSEDGFWLVANISTKPQQPVAIFYRGCAYEAIERN